MKIFMLWIVAFGLVSRANAGAADPGTGKGYVRVKLSASSVLVGSKVGVTGFSVKYGSLTQVLMTVTGPVTSPSQSIPLKDSGSFSAVFVPAAPGTYIITIKTSDGKAQQTATLKAFPFVEMDSITAPMKTQVQKAWDRLSTDVTKARAKLSPADAAALDQKVKTVTEDKDNLLKFIDDVRQAGKGLDGVERKYGKLPDQVSTEVGKLDDEFSNTAAQMEQVNDATGGSGDMGSPSHASYDNTICEYLVMINEACAAFSTIANFYGGCGDIIKNIVAGALIPAAIGAADNAVGKGAANTDADKEVGKLFAGSKADGEFFEKKLNAAGMAGDLVQMCANMLMKKYCAVMSGDLQENYTCTYRNEFNNVWWQYKYTTGATINLRYPKSGSTGQIIHMKGNIEGNATKFAIYTDMDEQDDFKRESKGRSHTIPICVYAPPAFPFVSAKADQATGFGALARTMVTPACFNIPIDVDYDVDAHTMKFYTNAAIIDFGPAVRYVYCYLVIAAGIPLITRVDLPINDVKLTLGKAISLNNTFPVQMDASNNLSVTAKGDSKVGTGTSCEHAINFTFSAKSN